MKPWMFLCLALTGCGTVPLGYVYSEQGQSKEQRTADIAICAEEGRLAASSPERQAASFAAGLTIVGAPIAIADARAVQRNAFAQCMVAKGYRVEPPK